ncbi:MAG TPA: class IV adenylate cyclase [Candidatus Bathyarchaeia archaeon]|nr:class IV adenylate cyclase [Candidatus Bathyarchaeia archaeon]
MLEAEIKLRLEPADVAALSERLVALGASALGTHLQVDTYFSHPTRDFATTDEALRLRCDGGRLSITYKGPKLDPPRKTREEIEFPLVASIETATAMLERLGFRPTATVRKERTDFLLAEGTQVSIDRVGELGCFCELEVAADDVRTGREALEASLHRLGLDGHRPIAESYLELLLAARRR